MTIITRFAPSPTGFLHIGGARTALFNYLFAKNAGGKFLLRIEDTDKKRSTSEAIEAILEGMNWLGLKSDEEPVYQSKNAKRHQETAHKLVEEGKAYYCYTSQEELACLRAEVEKRGEVFRFKSPYRDGSLQAPDGALPVVRLKSPDKGQITIDDGIKGEVSVSADEIDDLILLRADGTPTYMLAVVVDDNDMGITHIIRGDDHFTNSFRQKAIYDALDWAFPKSYHVPLIHGEDGAKLSKRHGALGVMEYEKMGFLPEAVNNYLLRLGWGLGDREIFSMNEAIQEFNKGSFGKSAARFDIKKLEDINNHYIKQKLEEDKEELASLVYCHTLNFGLSQNYRGIHNKDNRLPYNSLKENSGNDSRKKNLIKNSLHLYYERARTLNELANNIQPILHRQEPSEKDANILEKNKENVVKFTSVLEGISNENFTKENIKEALNNFVKSESIKFKDIGLPLRVAALGVSSSPDIAEIISILGKDEVLRRVK